MQITQTWSPSSIATSTTLSSIATTHASKLEHTISSVIERAKTETNYIVLRSLSQAYRGAQASLTIISAEEVLSTATVSSIQSIATQAIFEATLNLKDLADEENIFGYDLNRPGNIIYLIVYAIIMVYTGGMVIWSRYWWYNITFFCGYALEFIGFLGRVLAFSNTKYMPYFLMSTVCLTISPAFIMAAIYFLFGQLVIIHDRKFSVLPPLFYSYFFITIDVLSLLIQAGGGGAASVASSNHTDQKPGTNTMIAGIALQVFAMTIFVGFWFEFLNRLYFKKMENESDDAIEKHPLRKRSFSNFFKLLLNVKSVREYKSTYLEQFYNKRFESVRQHKLFPYMPLAMTVAVIVIYIRCVYRVVELAEGFGGYLMNHEVFLLVLDAAMIAIAGFIFFPFHPVWVFGKKNLVKLATIRKRMDVHSEDSDETKEELEMCGETLNDEAVEKSPNPERNAL
ncbi:uncharacterized protein KGF55_000701 [Candida pseudojiufengensis]|uniref:uncharacterized protein n=1 Tax=Candida pseudojiufengensis TaxID=497109 RepID=UPI0022243FF2|nr:uncharacterized protein KGF55_000701 [Candida pseudojiufengensis]KAI5966392.1 hypothetical protein KGF55_000701 [Candida pseudojiufengensis]